MRQARIYNTNLKRLILGSLLVGALALNAAGGPPSPRGSSATFDQIVASNPAEYARYQMKLTFTGDQTKTTPTLLLAGSGRKPNVIEFLPYRTSGIHYGNDEINVIAISMRGRSIQQVVQGLSERPPLQVSGGMAEPVLSLMIERGAPPTEFVFEHLANTLEAQQIITILRAAARSEPATTRESLRRFQNYTVGP
jgi:hypothetical protein